MKLSKRNFRSVKTSLLLLRMTNQIPFIFSFKRLNVIASISIVLLVPFFAGAATTDVKTPQAQCFTTLKENLVEAGVFSEALVELNKLSYSDIASKFSQNYKNLQSFGIELDKPNLEMRVYSFGRQTGYVHPPKLPFPSSYKSDMWIEPTKQFIVSEEYSVDANAQKYFISCSLFTIGSGDLLKVTRENYSYDGALISLTKTSPDNSYKAWFSQNSSFNYEDKPFVSWTRLFIYPKKTENKYFDKYSVADAFPTNKVQSFDVLKFFLQKTVSLNDYDESGAIVSVKYTMPDSKGNLVEFDTPKELLPIYSEGINKVFPLSAYYQAIESHFPEFATALSMRGTLKYDTYKQIITSPKVDSEISKIVDVINDPRKIASYSHNKELDEKSGMVVSDPEMDKMLISIMDADAAVSKITNENAGREIPEDQTTNNASMSSDKILTIAGGGVAACLIIGTLVWLRKRNANKIISYE